MQQGTISDDPGWLPGHQLPSEPADPHGARWESGVSLPGLQEPGLPSLLHPEPLTQPEAVGQTS